MKMKVLLAGIAVDINKLQLDPAIEVIRTSSVSETLEVLQRNIPDVVISEFVFKDGNGAVIFKSIQEKLGSEVVFVWYTSKSDEEVCDKDFYLLNPLNRYIPASAPAEDLIEAIKDTLAKKEEKEIGKYVRVSIERFKKFNSLPCDVFIKLSDNKVIKIINKDEMYSQEIIEKYKGKGIKYLFVQEGDFATFSSFVYTTLRSSVAVARDDAKANSEEIDVSEKDIAVVHDLIRHLNVEQSTVAVLNEVSTTSIRTINKAPALKDTVMSMMKEKGYLYGHCLMISYISGLIANKMRCDSKTTLQQLSIAAILHDIALDSEELARVEDLNDEKNSPLDWKTKEKIKKHPIVAANLATKIKDLLPDVSSIILSHHERPDGRGFPRGLGPTAVLQIGCIFIVAEDFVNRVCCQELNAEFLTKIKNDFSKKYGKGNFRAPLQGLLDVLAKV
ncbi:MAG: hypothetical protein A2504_02590 [Bdellovibrionales bacterium RIFOXYD12_FULL_39_22]|nr:MAG: hypothetical protein A2385_12620 [Bdellovibrionales bacterium RIFOXYB1_FULL_39_21]OFZ41192.1 MAG: hypothetical protein A2485_01030 [Bdellovibrionales bacterium RIFOXYC12_FULL_39_17]OFZ44946.1 MAG: hypothetical protein A2404_11775 [Bdellovibrionales bacterium RIFOXYC1_FULL_39_130]OFZ74393.1 MAG: hypothetical protein A2560_12145 [Bdellovibrionales bacterium RIFOXYD1_FULL_39_84]OFZ74715.1 MAG: hypothetical protein A2451_09895 [Bdellovibrionales bacterium RIFOXYC2_FULL_39_8]OFZ92395.1 MAG: